MGKLLILIGVGLMVLPFGVMAVEVAIAHLIGATGERLAQAGFWGVMVGFLTFIPGLLIALVGAFLSFFGRD